MELEDIVETANVLLREEKIMQMLEFRTDRTLKNSAGQAAALEAIGIS